jgi:predicted transcriptional regulator
MLLCGMNANELRDRRRRAGISQQALAQLAACSVSIVRLLERGYAPPESPTRDRIARVLAELDAEGRQAA